MDEIYSDDFIKSLKEFSFTAVCAARKETTGFSAVTTVMLSPMKQCGFLMWVPMMRFTGN